MTHAARHPPGMASIALAGCNHRDWCNVWGFVLGSSLLCAGVMC